LFHCYRYINGFLKESFDWNQKSKEAMKQCNFGIFKKLSATG